MQCLCISATALKANNCQRGNSNCTCKYRVTYFGGFIQGRLTQSKSKTQITRSVHGKFNCIPFKYDWTKHGIVILETRYRYQI